MEYYLVDSPKETYYPRTEGSVLINSPASSHKAIMWIKGAWHAINIVKKNDILLCYLDIQAVLCWWFAKLTFRKRNIVAINLLLKDKPTLKNRFASWLYKQALSSDNFTATVTAPKYGNWLNKKFNRKFKYYHLPDLYVYNNLYDDFKDINTTPNTVFCGGNNGRDWETMIRLAKEMPDVTFKLIMPKQRWDKYKSIFPTNIQAYYDVTEDFFLKEMASSQVVCLPINTPAPAGLIVLFQAAALRKKILISNTITTKGYITPNISDAKLISTQQEWNKALINMISDSSITPTLYQYLNQNCSRESYINRLNKIIFHLQSSYI